MKFDNNEICSIFPIDSLVFHVWNLWVLVFPCTILWVHQHQFSLNQNRNHWEAKNKMISVGGMKMPFSEFIFWPRVQCRLGPCLTRAPLGFSEWVYCMSLHEHEWLLEIHTMAVWTQKQFIPLLTHTLGSQGTQPVFCRPPCQPYY